MAPVKDKYCPTFSQVATFRREFRGVGSIAVTHDLIGRHGNLAPIIARELHSAVATRGILRVLDVGAYDRAFGRTIARDWPDWIYHSVDLDGLCTHDFYDFRDVTGMYDVIGIFEMIEHLRLEDGQEMLCRAFDHLSPNGRLFISTPNPFHPTQYFSDISHLQHWPARDLYSILRYAGFPETAIDLYGVIYRDPSALRQLIQGFRNFVWWTVGIERHGGLLAIARKS